MKSILPAFQNVSNSESDPPLNSFWLYKVQRFLQKLLKEKDKLLLNAILKNSHLMEMNGGNARAEARNIRVCLHMFIWVCTCRFTCMYVCVHAHVYEGQSSFFLYH